MKTLTQDQSLGTVTTTTNQSQLTYSLSAQEPDRALAIDVSTGALRVATPFLFDYETKPLITATVSVLGGGVTVDAPASVTLTNVDPELIRLLYHPRMRIGLDENEVGPVLEDILLSE